MIDLGKIQTTRGGKRVIALRYVPRNSAGRKVTFPIKGTVIEREKPLRTSYQIWTEDGEVDPVWGRNPERDLVES